MTDLKRAKEELEKKRRECAELELKIRTEEVGKTLEPVMGMMLANRELLDELAKYTPRESKVVLQALFGTPAIAEAFRAAARQSEPQLEKIRAKAERDRQRRAEHKNATADGATAAAQAAAQAAEQQQAVQQVHAPDAPQADPPAARQAVRPPVVPQTHPRVVQAPRV